MKNKAIVFWTFLGIVFLALIYFSLYSGTFRYSPEKKALWSVIFWQLRFPRMLLAILTGAALALGGVVYQALLKNPLAEPYLLGVSSGAALGAVTAIVLNLTLLTPFAFIGALGAFFLIISLAKLSGKISSYSLILSGLVLNSFFSAIISLLLSLFPRRTFSILFWLMGNLEVSNVAMLWTFAIAVLAVMLVLVLMHRLLDVISLGEIEAFHLGVDIPRTRLLLLVLSSVLVALAVSLTGIIGFVGLIVPHFARGLTGSGHLKIIPLAALLGAFFLLAGNVLIYGVLKNVDLPIGVFTALLGIPFLLYIFQKNSPTGG
jgi:iron complex transport system permease protein